MQLTVREVVTDRVRHPDRDGGLADPRRPREHRDRGLSLCATLVEEADERADHLFAAGEVRQVQRQLADRGHRHGEDGGHRVLGRGRREDQRGPQLPQPRAGFGAELVGQHLLGRFVGLDRVGRAAVGP